ncbi:hypothetical protein GCM10010837_51150 [Aminobacter niigataensis]
MDCVGYAFDVSTAGAPIFAWATGTVQRQLAVPLRSFLEGSLGDQQTRVKLHLEKLLGGNRSEIELIWKREGTAFRIRDSAQPAFDRHGRVVRIVGTVRHLGAVIWDSYAGENFWKEQAYDHIDFGIACWNTAGRLVLVNRKFRDLHGLIANSVAPGTKIEALVTMIARSGEVMIDGPRHKWVNETLSDLKNERSRDHRLADGRWIEASTIHFAEGTILRVHDVTQLKSSEHSLRQAKEAAETANFKKSRFLRAANHDLRQPLATLKILVYSCFGVKDEEKRRELLHSMDVTIGIMDEILGSLVQIGQLDAGRIETRITHFQLRQVLEPLAIEFRPQAEAKGIKMGVVASCETVQSDRALLGRILSNLIANAIRFTETGKIVVGARKRDAMLNIEIWDTGCGIAEDQLEMIFEEFHQVAEQSHDRQRGLGLGLNIAHRLSILLDHDINVRSWPSRGSVFSVSVPLGSIWKSDLGEPEISERIGGEFLDVKMLVVEDNEPLRRTVCDMLDGWGVQVTEASDSEQAIALFERGAYHFDLALVDFRLPNGRAGTDVLKELCEIAGREIPGIVATADNDPTLIKQIRAQGLPVLIKPINPTRLRSAMHHLLYEHGRDLLSHDH